MVKGSMMKKTLPILLILAVVLSSFLYLNFKAAKSETRANFNAATYSYYSTEGFQIDSPDRIYLYVEGDPSLSGVIRDNIRTELEMAGMDVEEAETFEEKYDFQALLVNVSEPEGLYTPVYASSNLEIMYFYTSTGKNTHYFEKFKEEEKGSFVVNIVNESFRGGEILVDGDLKLEDSTKGLVSRKAYRKHLAKEAAKNLVNQLQPHLRSTP